MAKMARGTDRLAGWESSCAFGGGGGVTARDGARDCGVVAGSWTQGPGAASPCGGGGVVACGAAAVMESSSALAAASSPLALSADSRLKAWVSPPGSGASEPTVCGARVAAAAAAAARTGGVGTARGSPMPSSTRCVRTLACRRVSLRAVVSSSARLVAASWNLCSASSCCVCVNSSAFSASAAVEAAIVACMSVASFASASCCFTRLSWSAIFVFRARSVAASWPLSFATSR
mmetsp:Transcript_17024/g.52859  ORF Transcript_17024/g.52859 Transcript_17024/m.52859 type:complete len:233 (+) Transcript_17024:88-786(+)